MLFRRKDKKPYYRIIIKNNGHAINFGLFETKKEAIDKAQDFFLNFQILNEVMIRVERVDGRDLNSFGDRYLEILPLQTYKIIYGYTLENDREETKVVLDEFLNIKAARYNAEILHISNPNIFQIHIISGVFGEPYNELYYKA